MLGTFITTTFLLIIYAPSMAWAAVDSRKSTRACLLRLWVVTVIVIPLWLGFMFWLHWLRPSLFTV